MPTSSISLIRPTLTGGEPRLQMEPRDRCELDPVLRLWDQGTAEVRTAVEVEMASFLETKDPRLVSAALRLFERGNALDHGGLERALAGRADDIEKMTDPWPNPVPRLREKAAMLYAYRVALGQYSELDLAKNEALYGASGATLGHLWTVDLRWCMAHIAAICSVRPESAAPALRALSRIHGPVAWAVNELLDGGVPPARVRSAIDRGLSHYPEAHAAGLEAFDLKVPASP